jgi:hypothetical protein
VEFLGDGGAADDLPALEDRHPEAGAGQVAGAGQAVVTGPDDNGIKELWRGLAAG